LVTKSGGGSTDTATRQGTYYFDAYALTNTSVPVAATLTASDGPNSTNFPAYVAKTAEGFTYDLDGNLLSDGRWDYTYDAENRITRMQSTSAAATALSGDARRIDFVYDYLGRRVRKTVYSGSSYGTTVSDEKFVWNGWLLIAKLNAASSNALLASYYWGTDLSGNTQGAGGVGGLLMTQENSNAYLPLYDAMGNVHAMLKASDGSIAAAYEYDAFGRTLRADGADATFAAANPWRFSTKYTDAESGLVYYGHRYYSPSLGRFINRDPIEEQGGLNLYAFCGNSGVNRWDMLGMLVRNDEGGGELDDMPGRLPGWFGDHTGRGPVLDAAGSSSGAANESGAANDEPIQLEQYYVSGDRITQGSVYSIGGGYYEAVRFLGTLNGLPNWLGQLIGNPYAARNANVVSSQLGGTVANNLKNAPVVVPTVAPNNGLPSPDSLRDVFNTDLNGGRRAGFWENVDNSAARATAYGRYLGARDARAFYTAALNYLDYLKTPRSINRGVDFIEYGLSTAMMAGGGGLRPGGGIRFAQQGISSNFRNGQFAKMAVRDIAAGLRMGVISADQLPLQVVVRDGFIYTLNNRSLMALRLAEMQPTIINDVTGYARFEAELTERLFEMGGHPPADFVPFIRP
jgi:RHS repeat-associated protein